MRAGHFHVETLELIEEETKNMVKSAEEWTILMTREWQYAESSSHRLRMLEWRWFEDLNGSIKLLLN